jgi:hypothetical protein
VRFDTPDATVGQFDLFTSCLYQAKRAYFLRR